MAKSLMQIRSGIKNQLRGGFQVDDDRFDEDLINDMIHDSRNVLLEQYYLKYRYFSDQFYQDVCCLEVYCHEIECVVAGSAISSGVSQYRVVLPNLFEIGGEVFIKYLGSVDFKNPASRRSLLGNIYSSGNIYTQDSFSYVLHDDYTVLENLITDGMKFICISAIMQNPLDLECVRLKEEDPYPIPDVLITKLERMVIDQLVKPMLMMNPNQRNNAIDDGKPYNNSKQRSSKKRNK